MRVSKERALENRARVVAAASRLFRERGFDGVGVDAVMREAGLTHGGFYANFGSKDDLMAEAVATGLADHRVRQKGQRSLRDFASHYLSPAHRGAVGDGCMLAALGPDAARRNPSVRSEATAHVRTELDRLATLAAPQGDARGTAITTLASAVGALVLSRLVDDRRLSDEILDTTKAALAKDAAA